jgi:hypothetical protein
VPLPIGVNTRPVRYRLIAAATRSPFAGARRLPLPGGQGSIVCTAMLDATASSAPNRTVSRRS